MFNIVKDFFSEHLQRRAVREAMRENEGTSIAEIAATVVRAHMKTLAKLNSVNLELSAANTRASKNAALALLAFGLIAIEILAVALYFLPK